MSVNSIDASKEVLQFSEIHGLAAFNGKEQLTFSSQYIECPWDRIRQLQNKDATVYAVILSLNRGGASVEIEGLPGFIPNSHLSRTRPKEEMIGEEFPLKFLEVVEERNRIILSHRRVLIEQKITHLQVGEVLSGTIQNMKPYGAFIDIGGVSALLHNSEISHFPIDTPHSVFNMNDEVKVIIINLDTEQYQISLSTKQLEAEPGDMVKNPQLVYDKAEEMAAKYRSGMIGEASFY
jgi:small subunit ribosomal protein S1